KGGLLILVKRRGKKGATLDASSIGGPLKTSKSLARCALFAAATTLDGIAAAQTLVLESPPAKVTGERHKGVFAEGAALSLGEKLQPLDPSPVKTVRLDTTHKIIEVAPGIKFSAWTFGDQVPGPTVRARGGGKIR